MRILIIVLSFLAFKSSGQSSIESLLSKWKGRKQLPEDSISVKLLLDISTAFRYDNTDSSLYYAKLAEQHAQVVGDQIGLGNAITSQGIGYYIMGSYDLSLTAHSRALEIHKATNNRGGLSLSYNGMGLVYLGQEDMPRSIPYFRQAININKASRDSTLLANNYFNMGIIYDHLEVFDSAYYYLHTAELICDRVKNYRTKLMVNNRLAEMLYRQQKYDEALTQFKAVLAADYYQSNWETTFAYAGMAQTYVKLGNPNLAIEAGKKAVEYGELVGAIWDIERALKILSEAYAADRDYENAYLTHQRYKAYSDTLFNQDKEKEINYLFLRQKEAENGELQSENELKEQQLKLNTLINVVFGVAIVSLILIAAIIIRSNKLKEKLNRDLEQKKKDIERQKELIEEQNKKLAKLNETNSLILAIISHDLRSPVASIQSMMGLIKTGLVSPKEQRDVFIDLENRINNIADMMYSLLNWARGQFTGLKANLEHVVISDIATQLILVFEHRLREKGISITHDQGERIEVLADQAQLRIILQNLLSNAIKFTQSGGNISVFYSSRHQLYSIHIKDSGVGMDKRKLQAVQSTTNERITELGTEQETGSGLGLILVRQFVEYNQGQLEIYSEPGQGSEFVVTLQKNTISEI